MTEKPRIISQQPTANSQQRNLYLDVAKGIAIILVVIGHDMYNFYGYSSLLFKLIYSFHMPFFMLISGMVFSLKFNELPSQTFSASHEIMKSLRGLFVPFICWTVINGVIRYRDSMLCYFWDVIENLSTPFWFLIVLFWCRGLFALIHALCIKIFRKPSAITLASVMIVIYVFLFIMTKLFLPENFLGGWSLRLHFPYFAAGVFVYQYRKKISGFFDKISVNIAIVIIFAAVCGLIAYCSHLGFKMVDLERWLKEFSCYGEILYRIIARVKPIPGIFAALLLTRLILRFDFKPLTNALSFTGKKTLGIYTYHEYFRGMFFPPVILPLSAGIILTLITEKIPVVRSLLLGK